MKYDIIYLALFYVFTFYYQIEARESKFWPLGLGVGVVRFANNICTTDDGYDGICYTRRECRSAGGTASGICSQVGRCCIFQATCGAVSSQNNTYFVNSGYPNAQTAGGLCTYVIKKCNSGICQARIDFLTLELAQPDGEGYCINDYIAITGGTTVLRPICGELSGQHVYINFNGDTDITITISTNVAFTFARTWLLKVAQIGCDCPTLAPAGCLMYYTSQSGTVNSFNYGTSSSGSFIVSDNNLNFTDGTREIANENYLVCIKMLPGYCTVQWSKAGDWTSFTVTGDSLMALLTNNFVALKGGNCTTDYVVIPNAIYTNGTSANADRFCGNDFLPVTSSSFTLTVVTNGNETNDQANRGFSLNYVQRPCTTNYLQFT